MVLPIGTLLSNGRQSPKDGANVRWEPMIEYAGASDVGMRRSNNQDSWAIHLAPDRESWEKRGHLMIVADGMGAHAVGELASKLAADMILLNYRKQPEVAPEEALRRAFQEANASICNRGRQNQEFAGMGTTATVLAMFPDRLWLAHVGDSRAYRIRAGRIDQLTFDHSLSWELMRRGKLRQEHANQLPRNIIVRSLGPEPQIEVDLEGPFPVQPGDVYLLCSDGLSGQVSDAHLGVLAELLSPQEACRVLVDLANLRGGPDNITVVVARLPVVETPAGASPALSSRGIYRRTFRAVGQRLCKLWKRSAAQTPSGNAPYRTAACQAAENEVAQLAALESQLRRTAVEDAWKVDWSSFFAHHNRAEPLAKQQQWNLALEAYSRAVSFLMAGMRQHRKATQSERSKSELRR